MFMVRKIGQLLLNARGGMEGGGGGSQAPSLSLLILEQTR